MKLSKPKKIKKIEKVVEEEPKEEDLEAVMQKIVDATNSGDIFLRFPPKYICAFRQNTLALKFILLIHRNFLIGP